MGVGAAQPEIRQLCTLPTPVDSTQYTVVALAAMPRGELRELAKTVAPFGHPMTGQPNTPPGENSVQKTTLLLTVRNSAGVPVATTSAGPMTPALTRLISDLLPST